MWKGFSGGSVVKNHPGNAGDTGSISGLGRSPGEGNGSPLQYSCLMVVVESLSSVLPLRPGGL